MNKHYVKNTINKFVNNDNIRYFIRNTLFVGVSQLISILVPVIIIPFIIKKIGLSYFGEYSIAFSIAMLTSIIVEFGFNLYGINLLAKKDDKEKETYYISNIIILKLTIFIVVAIVFVMLILLVPYFNRLSSLYLLLLMVPLSSIFNNSWYFQAKQKLFIYALTNVLSRALYFILVIIIIYKPTNYIYILPIYGISILLPNILFTIIINNLFIAKYFNFIELKKLFNESKNYFIANISIFLTTSFYVPIVGYVLNNQSAGIYALIEKIYSGFRNIFNIYINVILPRYTRIINDKHKTKKLLKETYPFVVLLIIIVIIMVLYFKKYIITFFLHTQDSKVENLLSIAIFGLIFLAFNVPFFIHFLAKNYKNEIRIITILSSIISIISCFLLTYLFELIGSMVNIIFFEIIFLSLFLFKFKTKKL